MKNFKRFLFVLSLALTTTMLFSSCSKDSDDNSAPEEEQQTSSGTATATITYMDTDETVEFSGTALGAIGTGSQDTVVMIFSGKDHPMAFWIMLTPADKGQYTMGEGGFECSGIFYQDSLKVNVKQLYLVGVDNMDDNGTEMDGKASFNITSQTTDNIKGTFELTMIQNSTVYQNGELQSGEIKKVKITNGTFNCPLYEASDFDDFDDFD